MAWTAQLYKACHSDKKTTHNAIWFSVKKINKISLKKCFAMWFCYSLTLILISRLIHFKVNMSMLLNFHIKHICSYMWRKDVYTSTKFYFVERNWFKTITLYPIELEFYIIRFLWISYINMTSEYFIRKFHVSCLYVSLACSFSLSPVLLIF